MLTLTSAHVAAALVLWPAAQGALGWPLALLLTLLWLAAAERGARRTALQEARRDWEAEHAAQAQAPRDGGGESLEWLNTLLTWCDLSALLTCCRLCAPVTPR